MRTLQILLGLCAIPLWISTFVNMSSPSGSAFESLGGYSFLGACVCTSLFLVIAKRLDKGAFVILAIILVSGTANAQCDKGAYGFLGVKWGSNNAKQPSSYLDFGVWAQNVPLYASVSIGGQLQDDSLSLKANNTSMGVFQLSLKAGAILKRANKEYEVKDNAGLYINLKHGFTHGNQIDVGVEYMLFLSENRYGDNLYLLLDGYKTMNNKTFGANLGIRFGL